MIIEIFYFRRIQQLEGNCELDLLSFLIKFSSISSNLLYKPQYNPSSQTIWNSKILATRDFYLFWHIYCLIITTYQNIVIEIVSLTFFPLQSSSMMKEIVDFPWKNRYMKNKLILFVKLLKGKANKLISRYLTLDFHLFIANWRQNMNN